jgi:hypothetical protein
MTGAAWSGPSPCRPEILAEVEREAGRQGPVGLTAVADLPDDGDYDDDEEDDYDDVPPKKGKGRPGQRHPPPAEAERPAGRPQHHAPSAATPTPRRTGRRAGAGPGPREGARPRPKSSCASATPSSWWKAPASRARPAPTARAGGATRHAGSRQSGGQGRGRARARAQTDRRRRVTPTP